MAHDNDSIAVIQAAMERVTGETLPVTISPFVCDANFWFPLGQPSLIFGVGDPSWGIHGANEHVPVADLIKATKVFAAVTMDWCGVAE